MAASTAVVRRTSKVPQRRAPIMRFFEPSDAGALRDALRRALDDPSCRAELIASGEQRAGEFSLRHVAERFITLYESAIERRAVTR
jgi:glycosyltransferase involved in cell wall biosynthesis